MWNYIHFKRRTGGNWTSLDKTPLTLKLNDLFEKGLCSREKPSCSAVTELLFIPEAVTFLGHTMTITDPDGKTAIFKRFDGTRDKELMTFELESSK